MSRNKNLTYDERCIIQKGIHECASKSAIGKTIGKDETTVAKEIRNHRFISYKTSLQLECANYKKCKYNRKCNINCPCYVAFVCKRRDKSPGACNGCSNYNSCRFNKYKYDATKAQHDYESVLVSSRVGIDLTKEERENIASIVCPLIKNGHSPYQIVTANKELNISEKTLYNYIEYGVFKEYGVTIMDLRSTVSRKISKKAKTEYKKRNDWKFLINRKYEDYCKLKEENPNLQVVQMDTVYNDISNGPFLQTFKFIDFGLLIAIYSTRKDQDSMVKGFEKLYAALGEELFKKYVDVILTDRGTEFSCPERIEKDENGNKRCLVFYCDPMASCQKGSIENNHKELRYFFPKEKDLEKLGLTSQNNLNIVLSHLNSVKKDKYKGKSPLELVQFYAPDLYEKLSSFGIKIISNDEIILNTNLLKK